MYIHDNTNFIHIKTPAGIHEEVSVFSYMYMYMYNMYMYIVVSFPGLRRLGRG